MPIIKPTTRGELYWWKNTWSFLSGGQKGHRRTDMYVMEAIRASKRAAFNPSHPMIYRLAFYFSSTLKEVRMMYSQHGRYSWGRKPTTLIWTFKSKTAASEWYSKIIKKVASVKTFITLTNNIATLRNDARKYKGKKRG